MVQKPFEELTIADDTAKQCMSCTLLSYGAVQEVLFYYRLYSPYFTEIGWHKTFVIQLGNQCTSVHDCFGFYKNVAAA